MTAGKHFKRFLGRLAMAMVMCALILPSAAPGAVDDASQPDQAPGRTLAQQATKDRKLWITADHKKHEALKKSFASGPEVTQACLSCHSEAAHQFHQTIHWTWMDPNSSESNKLGKGGLSINNF